MMHYILRVFLLSIGLISIAITEALGQNAVIERKYNTTYFNKQLSSYKDTTCNVVFSIRNGRVSEVSICVATYDREHVQSATISFNGNNIGTLNSFLKTLEKSKGKYQEWSEIVRSNNVSKFSKDMENKTTIKKHRMEFNFCYDSLWYQSLKSSDRGLPMPLISPIFRVDNGECLIEVGKGQVVGTRFRLKQRQGYVPSIWSAIVTDAIDPQSSSAMTGLIAMQFRNEQQLQSLINAFNIDAELTQIRQKHQEKQEQDKAIDNLFK